MPVMLNSKDHLNLFAAINHVLCTISSTEEKCTEPAIVAKLTVDIPRVVKKWNSIQEKHSNIRFYSCGSFVHGRPWAMPLFNNSDKRSVEIGDLLLITNIFKSTNDKEPQEQRAMLLQAKKHGLNQLNGTCVINITPPNDIQRTLYNQWPEFQYTSPQNLRDQHRHIQGNDIYPGTQYLLINSDKDSQKSNDLCPVLQPRVCADYLTAYPEEPLGHFNSFADELVNFILGNAGKVFKSDTESRTNLGWDNVIYDLIDYCKTHDSSFVHKEGTKGKGRRMQDGRYLMYLPNIMPIIDDKGLSDLSECKTHIPNNSLIAQSENEQESDEGGFGIIFFSIVVAQQHD